MTHSLHRIGTRESFENDYVVLFVPSRGINDLGSGDKARIFLELLRRHHAKHYGDDLTGNVLTQGHEKLVKNAHDITNIHGVFSSFQRLIGFIEDVVKANLGISVVISGLLDKVKECTEVSGAEYHTVEVSLGFWGKKEKLPPEDILEITTMCGHGYVTTRLVYDVLEKVRKGIYSPRCAAEKLAKTCVCGIFNPDRAAKLISELSGKSIDKNIER